MSRFFDEARAVNLIGHENIVGIYDLSVLPPRRYYFVMEYLEGQTLQALLRAGSVDPRVATDVLLQMCDALQCAHDHGVVHRDLKPENVFLVQRRGKSHFVKLVDFGIAKLRGAGSAGRTQAGFIVGTPEYMAPEQCDDAPIDARTDVYALGVIAFELATGRLPFRGTTVPQLLLAHLREKPQRPSELAAVEPALERAILRALEKDPAARFQGMAAFADALRAVPAARTPHSTIPLPAAAPASAATPSAPAAPAPPPPSPADALVVEVARPGGTPVRSPAVDLTRGGLFLRADGAPPSAPRARARLARASFAPGEGAARGRGRPPRVARRRSGLADDAWLRRPVREPDARSARAAVGGARGRAPAPTRRRLRRRPRPRRSRHRLAELEARRDSARYALLAAAPDAEFTEACAAPPARSAAELEPLRARPQAADHPPRATALLARVDAAQHTLGTPAARLALRRRSAATSAASRAASRPACRRRS